MSRFSIMPSQAILDKRLSPRDLSVLAAIGTYTDRVGWCFPSQTTLGVMLGISRQAIQKSIRALVDCHYLQVAQRYEGTRQTSNLMRVLFDSITEVDQIRLVAPPATSEVAPPATPEVALTSHLTSQLTIKRGQQADRFEEWWKEYPKKTKKKEAFRVWGTAKLDLLCDRLLEDVRRRMVSDDRWKRGFIPDPTTYLRGERWNDEIVKPAGQVTTPKPAAHVLYEEPQWMKK